MKRKHYSFILLSLLTALHVQAQVFPFDSVKASILNTNPELEMYMNQAKAFDAQAEGAKAWEAPQIGAGFFMTPYKTSYWKDQAAEVNGMPVTNSGMGNFMIQGKQMIPNPSRLKANQQYMKAMSAAEYETQKTAANDLLYQAKTAYNNLQIIHKKLLVIAEAENTLNGIIRLSERSIAYNQSSLQGVYKAKAQLALLYKDKAMLENERSGNTYMLNTLMNRSGEKRITIDTAIILLKYETNIIDTTSVIVNRSDLRTIDKNIRITQLKQQAEVYKSRPDFGIEYGHMFTFGGNPNMFTLMGMMTIPIAPWSSKMYQSNIKASQYQIKAMQNQKQTILNEAGGSLYRIRNELTSSKYQVQLYETMILPALQKSYDIGMIAYAQNTGSLMDALDARMNIQMAQIQYLDILRNVLLLQADYEKELQLL